jgi:serine/threonine protein kinase/Tol biopolymer transport system component
MGEVYRARDTRLDRLVAIKVLPKHLAEHPDLRDRLEREARAVARLNHPHICTLYDVGSADGLDFLVLELLEGKSLEQRLTKGPLPLGQALGYACDIADALDQTHREGVVHRDLKPGNVFLARTGGRSDSTVVKVLDFGLAKVAPALAGIGGSMAPTMKPITGEGSIVGTLQYMAPEQLEGHEADPRTDVFAFGALLYEMVTGRRAFDGKSQVTVIAAILEHDPPPIASLLPLSPPLLGHVLRTCLAKAPDDRWQSMRDVVIELKAIDNVESVQAAPAQRRSARSGSVPWIATAVALIAAAIAIAGWWSASTRSSAISTKTVFQVDFPWGTGSSLVAPTLSISPDGKQLVAMVTSARGSELRIRPLDHLETRLLAATPTSIPGAVFPFWSPDSRFVAYFDDAKLQRVDTEGNPPEVIADLSSWGGSYGGGGTWSRQGVILYAPSQQSPLFQISASGGKPVQVTELDASRDEVGHVDPQFLPDGIHFLYLALNRKPEQSAVFVGSLQSRERKRLLATNWKVLFAAPEHLLFLRQNALMAQRFDPSRLELSGAPFRVVEPVALSDLGGGDRTAGVSVSDQGTLAYRATVSTASHLLWFDRSGRQIGEVGSPAPYATPALSPDLQRIAVVNAGDLWVLDLVRNGASRVTFTAPNVISGAPLWSGAGDRLVYATYRAESVELRLKNADGSGPEQVVLRAKQFLSPEDWSPSNQTLLYLSVQGNPGRMEIWALPLTGKTEPQPIVRVPAPGFAAHARFSPDGRWVAYVSTESGHPEVFVQAFSGTGGRWQVSTQGGAQPRWRRDGKELFFVSLSGDAMTVDVKATEGAFSAGTPKVLFRANPATVFTGRNSWDVSPDGQRFLINSASPLPPITVMLNWNK